MTLTVLNLHQKTDPQVVPTQPPIPYGTPTHPNQCPYQISTSYTLRFPRYKPGQDFIGQGHYSKVKGQIKVTS